MSYIKALYDGAVGLISANPEIAFRSASSHGISESVPVCRQHVNQTENHEPAQRLPVQLRARRRFYLRTKSNGIREFRAGTEARPCP